MKAYATPGDRQDSTIIAKLFTEWYLPNSIQCKIAFSKHYLDQIKSEY